MKNEPDVPAPTALGDGITQIRLPMTGNPLRYVNGYLIVDDDGPLLVDCGWKLDDVYEALVAGLRASGFALADLRRLIVTHHHFDHYGLAGTLRRQGVPELLMHARDWERVKAVADERSFDSIADAWLARNGYDVGIDDEEFFRRWELAEPTHFPVDGERIGRLEAIWTPGHSPGHLCFFDTRSGRMLTGDHVLDPITPHVGYWHEQRGDPMGDYVASLTKVAARETSGALPAHGEPFGDLRGRAAAIVAHTAERERAILTVLAASPPHSATEVAQALPWTRRQRSFAELGEFHQQFAVAETIAHLEHLHRRGEVTREDAGPLITYAVARRAA